VALRTQKLLIACPIAEDGGRLLVAPIGCSSGPAGPPGGSSQAGPEAGPTSGQRFHRGGSALPACPGRRVRVDGGAHVGHIGTHFYSGF
jgi:hypothetical protein